MTKTRQNSPHHCELGTGIRPIGSVRMARSLANFTLLWAPYQCGFGPTCRRILSPVARGERGPRRVTVRVAAVFLGVVPRLALAARFKPPP